MRRPQSDFDEIITTLRGYAQSLLDNNRLGESKLVLAFAELVKVTGWSSEQADTNNIQVANLTEEIKDLKTKLEGYSKSSGRQSWVTFALTVVLGALTLVVAYGSYRFDAIQAAPILEQQSRAVKSQYEFCKEPGNWNVSDGGATPGSNCKESYLRLREQFGAYQPAEDVLERTTISASKD